MVRMLSIAILGLAGLACNGSDDTTVEIATLFPANNEIGSWVEDPDAIVQDGGSNPSGVEVADTSQEALDMINGDADVFDNHSFVALGREFYTTGDAQLELRIWRFPDAREATSLYEDLPGEDSRYAISWNTASFGDAARMVDTGVSYWYNVRTGVYFVEIMGLTPNDATTQAAGETFLSGVLNKIP
jgi:hypothetical protein